MSISLISVLALADSGCAEGRPRSCVVDQSLQRVVSGDRGLIRPYTYQALLILIVASKASSLVIAALPVGLAAQVACTGRLREVRRYKSLYREGYTGSSFYVLLKVTIAARLAATTIATAITPPSAR